MSILKEGLGCAGQKIVSTVRLTLRCKTMGETKNWSGCAGGEREERRSISTQL